MSETVEQLRAEMDALDEDIMHLIELRTELARHIGDVKVSSGTTRVTISREISLIKKYKAKLGNSGVDIANSLLSMSRGEMSYLAG